MTNIICVATFTNFVLRNAQINYQGYGILAVNIMLHNNLFIEWRVMYFYCIYFQ